MMDMIFKRYSCPFDFIESHIKMGTFTKALKRMADEINDEKLWELYLRSYSDKSFIEWKKEIMKPNTKCLSKGEVMAEVEKAKDILNSFKIGVSE